MKKKNFKHSGLRLTKSVVSNLASENVKGGFTASCLADADTNCATVNCGSGNCSLGCGPSNGCPPTNGCPPSISCQPFGIC
ncbi:MAG: hypothetical protein AAF611_00990 [Bacteroidota bacterium]